MTEATTDTYVDWRDYVINNYTNAALIDDTGSKVIDIDIPNDGRAQWTNTSSSNPITLEINLTGSDSDIPLPTTFAQIKLKPSSAGNTRYSDPFTNATIEASGDTVTLTTDVSIPQ